tara:strand:+ start:624 stop:1082 length:459 start_codon:yes stop_codon:yes gene_type:complete
MAIAQTVTTSFKVQLLQAVHNFGPTSPNTFKIALFTGAANISASTTAYTVGMTGEVANGSGYTTGGNTLVISTSPTSGNNTASIPTAFISFSNTSWTNATFTARGALIYNDSVAGDPSVAVLDFGADKTVNNDTFQIIFPTPDANSAIVRIS